MMTMTTDFHRDDNNGNDNDDDDDMDDEKVVTRMDTPKSDCHLRSTYMIGVL